MKPAQSVQLRDSVGADTGKCWAWHGQDSVSALGEDHQGKTCIFTGALQSGSPRASTQEVLQTCLKYLFLDPRVKWRNCTSGSLRSFLRHSGVLWLVPRRMGESESTFVQQRKEMTLLDSAVSLPYSIPTVTVTMIQFRRSWPWLSASLGSLLKADS